MSVDRVRKADLADGRRRALSVFLANGIDANVFALPRRALH